MRGTTDRGGWRVGLVLLVVWAVAVALASVLGNSGVILGAIIGGACGVPGALVAIAVLTRARAGPYARRNQVECDLRVVDGYQAGLGPRWRHGVGTLTPGLLIFRGTVGGVRALPRTPLTVEVHRIDRVDARRTGLPEMWSVRPGTEVVGVVTPSARLEWGVPASRMRWVIDQLHSPQDDAGAR